MSALPALSFGALLRHHRLAAGLTQEQLAERAGVSPRAIIALEGGERRRPHRQTFQLLASALRLTGRDVEILEQAAGYTRSAREHPMVTPDVQAAPFVGRGRELGAIDRFLRNPRPSVLLFVGEPGIGKSRLLDEAARLARARGFTVFQGGGHRRSGQEPYAPLLETLSRSLTSFSAPQLRAALVGCGWLVRLLPELMELVSSPLPLGTLPVEQERRLTFDAVARYLANIAGPAGTLLVLDDLQWASPDGLDLLMFLLRSGTSRPILMIGAYRDTEVSTDHALSATLGDLAEHNMAERLMVEPLEAQHVTELLDALLPGDGGTADDDGVRQEIVRRAGGLPFYLVSCVQGLAVRAADKQRGSPVPWSVSQSVRQRMAALPDGAQQVLQATAVVGRAVDRRVLLGMSLASEHDVLSGLDATCRARLTVLEGETEYRFTHDVIREVIEADLGSEQRRLLHRSVGESLERMPERDQHAAELAWHFLEADDRAKALHHSLLAGDEAVSVFAYGEAVGHYRTALEMAGEEDLEREAEALEKLGWVLRNVGRFDEALETLERAAKIHQRAGNSEAEGEIVAKIGWGLSQVGEPAEGITRLQSAVEKLEERGPSLALVALYEALVHLYKRQGRFQDVLIAAERVSELAQALGDESTRVRGELYRSDVLLGQDRVDDALQVLEGVIPAAEAVGDSETLGRALLWAAGTYAAQGAFDRSKTYFERLIELRQRTSSPDYVATALSGLGHLLFLQGDWEQARAQCEQAAEMTSALTSHQAGWVRLSLAELCLLEGRWQDAITHLEECMSVIEQTGDRGTVPEVHALMAQSDLFQGRPDAALARLEPLLNEFELDHDALITLAETYVETGNAVRANEVVAAGAAQAARQNNRLALVDWKRLQGRLMAGQGRWEEAKRVLSDAVSQASEMPYPFGKARALFEWGRLGVEHGDIAQAQEHLEEALAVFQRLGAHPSMEQTEEALSDLPPFPGA